MADSQELGWLIRDTGNRIRGPYKQAEIVQLIKKGQLRGKTEISRANSYWFAIEEKTELGRFLPEFNGGKPPPEQPTQMTATLTEADVRDQMDVTTFTAVKPEGGKPDAGAPEGGQIEWLSDELAEEFGDDFGTSISLQTDASSLGQPPPEPAGAQDPNLLPEEQDEPTLKDARGDAKKREEIMRRATVKADTLPSEHKSFQGDRPKPIDALMRGQHVKPGVGAAKEAGHGTVNVPVEDSPAPKMFIEDDEGKGRDRSGKRNFLIFAVVAVVIVAGGAAAFLLPGGGARKAAKEAPRHVRKAEESMAVARQSVITFDLEGAKSALADLDLETSARGDANTFLAQAVVKKEFLYDVEGALLALQSAKQKAPNRQVEAEVDNLIGVYGFDRDPASALETLKRNAEANKGEPVFQYNLALAQLRSNHQAEALAILESLLASAGNDESLIEDVAIAQGWGLESHCNAGTRDAVCKRAAEAEDAYLRALEANPYSPKARLGLALFRLRRQGIKGSEGDFRSFLDLAPELDPPSRVMSFRKLSNNEFYAFAHSQIVDLNTPNQNMSKPSPLIMAADAIVSCIQGRTSEAGKILEGALSTAPGDGNVLKATGYLRWKDGQVNELVDALHESRDRNSFALNLMLGKSYAKLHRRDLAEKHFRAMIELFPGRSEGHSLLGELLAEQSDKATEAKNEFQLALRKDPFDLVALRGLQRLNVNAPLSPELRKNLPF